MSAVKVKKYNLMINKTEEVYVNLDGSHYEKPFYIIVAKENKPSLLINNEQDITHLSTHLTTSNNHQPIKNTLKTKSKHRNSLLSNTNQLSKLNQPLSPKSNSYLKTESLIRDFNQRVKTFVFNTEHNFHNFRLSNKKLSSMQKESNKERLNTENSKSIFSKRRSINIRGNVNDEDQNGLNTDLSHYKQFLNSVKKLSVKAKGNKKYFKKNIIENNEVDIYPKLDLRKTMDFSRQMPRKQFIHIKTKSNNNNHYPNRPISPSQIDEKTKLVFGKGRSHLCSKIQIENESRYLHHMHKGIELHSEINKLNIVAKTIFLSSRNYLE